MNPSRPRAYRLSCLLALSLLYPIFCSGQDVPPGALLSETVLRISAGSSGTGTQPPFAPTTRPASLTLNLERDCRVEGHATHVSCAPVIREPVSSPASSAPKLLPLALTYAGLQLVDGWQTTVALNSGRYREANGALSSIAGSPWKLGLVKGAVTSGSLLGICAMRKQHPKASRWLLVGLAGAQSGIVIWNARQMR